MKSLLIIVLVFVGCTSTKQTSNVDTEIQAVITSTETVKQVEYKPIEILADVNMLPVASDTAQIWQGFVITPGSDTVQVKTTVSKSTGKNNTVVRVRQPPKTAIERVKETKVTAKADYKNETEKIKETALPTILKIVIGCIVLVLIFLGIYMVMRVKIC